MSRRAVAASALAIFILGVILRLALVWVSYGTNDVTTWIRHSGRIAEFGLAEDYRLDPDLNHPPGIAFLMSTVFSSPALAGLRDDVRIKLPGMAGELAVLCALLILTLRSPTPRNALRLAALSFSAINILIGGYHGNTDSLMAAAVFLSCLSFEAGRYRLSGFLLAAAVEVKLIPLLLVPLFIAGLPRGKRADWLLWFAAGLVPLLLAAVLVGEPFLNHAFGYSSFQDYWGVMLIADALLGLGGNGAVAHDAAFIEMYRTAGKLLIVAAVCWLACRSESRSGRGIFSGCSRALCLFAVFAPGIGVQYFALFPPLLCKVSPGWSFLIGSAAGALAIASYSHYLVSIAPLRSEHLGLYGAPEALLGLVLWMLLALCFLRLKRTDDAAE